MRQRRQRNNQITKTAERNPNVHLGKNAFKQTRSIKKRLPKQQKNSYVGLATDFKERYKKPQDILSPQKQNKRNRTITL